MRDYGIVSPRFWTGETGKKLRGDPDAQVLALYLMTSPHSTMTGVFHCPILYMSHETGIPLEGASKALARLIEGAFCEYDEASETVFVVQMAKFQIGDQLKPNDKRVFGLRKEVERMQKTHLKQRFLECYAELYCLGDLLEKPSPFEAPSKPLRSQEQEQEQEQEQDQEQEQSPRPASADHANTASTATPTPTEHPVDRWQPDREILKTLKTVHGVPDGFITESVTEFRAFWRKQVREKTSWDSAFFKSCIGEWKKTGHNWKPTPVADQPSRRRLQPL